VFLWIHVPEIGFVCVCSGFVVPFHQLSACTYLLVKEELKSIS